MGAILVAAYERTVAASLARVWENVLDWEHLPWLHRETFAYVEVLAQGPDGWRARTAARGGRDPRDFVVDVEIDRAGLEYHTRTVEGPGTGTDIVTRLIPAGDTTHIQVEFHVPDVPLERAASVGARWVRLYARLWDEDEAMMRRRQALLDGRLVGDVRTVELDGARLRFASACPHRGGPLGEVPVVDGCITCPWHGYRFDVRTGRSADGRFVLDGGDARRASPRT